MSSPRRRRFTWFDAAALVAATALGLFMTNSQLENMDEVPLIFGPHHAIHGFRRWGYAVIPLFVSWSLILLGLRFLGPRPRFRRLARSPGLVTSLVIAFLTLREVSRLFAWQLKYGPGMTWQAFVNLFVALPSWLAQISEIAGFAVAATWFALWLGRWWRPETTWIDRAGRVLGCYWLFMFVIDSYYNLAS